MNENFNIIEHDLGQEIAKLNTGLKFIIVQFNWVDVKDVDRHNKIWYGAKWDEQKIKFVKAVFQFAKEKNVNLIVFPEITFPVEFHYLAKNHCLSNPNTIVVAGSSYEEIANSKGKWYSVSKIFLNDKEYKYEKNKLSSSIEKNYNDFENTPIDGGSPCILKNTIFGDIGFLVCSDYLHDPLRNYYLSKYHDINLLIVIAFNNKSESNYFKFFDAGIRNLPNPFPIIFCNNYMKSISDGQSSFFAFLDDKKRKELLNNGYITDNSFNHQVAEFIDEEGIIFSEYYFNQHKRGEKSKTIYTEDINIPKFYTMPLPPIFLSYFLR